LHRLPGRAFTLGREALRTLLHRSEITFQRTKTWKDSPDPDFDAKLDAIEYALTQRRRPSSSNRFLVLSTHRPGESRAPSATSTSELVSETRPRIYRS
jgi:hypothetical protein